MPPPPLLLSPVWSLQLGMPLLPHSAGASAGDDLPAKVTVAVVTVSGPGGGTVVNAPGAIGEVVTAAGDGTQ